MSQPPRHRPDPVTDPAAGSPPVLNPTAARGGTTGNKVRYVLLASVIIAALALLFTWAVSPKAPPDAAPTAPGRP